MLLGPEEFSKASMGTVMVTVIRVCITKKKQKLKRKNSNIWWKYKTDFTATPKLLIRINTPGQVTGPIIPEYCV